MAKFQKGHPAYNTESMVAKRKANGCPNYDKIVFRRDSRLSKRTFIYKEQ